MRQRGNIIIILAIMFAVMAGIFYAIYQPEPKGPVVESGQQREDREAMLKASALAAVGALAAKRSARNPDSVQIESAKYVASTQAACFKYRAQNGFGGTNVLLAVAHEPSDQFATSEMAGFDHLWGQLCADRSGLDVTRSARIAAR